MWILVYAVLDSMRAMYIGSVAVSTTIYILFGMLSGSLVVYFSVEYMVCNILIF